MGLALWLTAAAPLSQTAPFAAFAKGAAAATMLQTADLAGFWDTRVAPMLLEQDINDEIGSGFDGVNQFDSDGNPYDDELNNAFYEGHAWGAAVSRQIGGGMTYAEYQAAQVDLGIEGEDGPYDPAAKQAQRDAMAQHVQAFMDDGGAVSTLEQGMTSDWASVLAKYHFLFDDEFSVTKGPGGQSFLRRIGSPQRDDSKTLHQRHLECADEVMARIEKFNSGEYDESLAQDDSMEQAASADASEAYAADAEAEDGWDEGYLDDAGPGMGQRSLF